MLDLEYLEKVFANTATTTDARVKYLGANNMTQEGTFAVNVSTAYDGSNTIAGTINGVAGTGVGNTLTGATGDPSEGLQFSVVQGASGNMGTITFSKGLAERLSDWIGSLTDEELISRIRTLANPTPLERELARLKSRKAEA